MTCIYRISILAFSIIAAAGAAGQGLDRAISPPGRMVDIGGYRLHLWCTGTSVSGQPTVVLSAGSGDFAVDWSLVQQPLSDSARVCSYDRSAFGWSEAGPNPHSLTQEAYELHLTLQNAGEHPPFILVGHSLGALVVRRFVAAYENDVGAVVLVGPTHEGGRLMVRGQFVPLRSLASDRPVPAPRKLADAPPEPLSAAEADSCRSRAYRTARIVRPYDQLRAQAQRYRVWLLEHPVCVAAEDDFLPEEMARLFAERQKNGTPLGNIPLVVVYGTRGVIVPPGVNEEALRREIDSLRNDYAHLSRSGRLVIDTLSGHHVQLDNPAVVVRVIRDVLRARR
jgi:pimeloyl-ACP methyl ester carboxylesterase